MKLLKALALASILAALATPAVAARPMPLEDPIRFTGHGAAYGPDGRQVEVTAAFIAHAQALYTAQALLAATPVQRARFDYKRSYLTDLSRGAVTGVDRQSALYANSLLLDWLIDEVKPPEAARLKLRNRMLQSWLSQGLGHLDGQVFVMPAHLRAQVTQAGLAAPAAVAGPTAKVMQDRETYAKQCIKSGVPVPPTWGKNGPGLWNSRTALSAPFISNALTAELFEYQSAKPEGVCLALPRYAPGAATPIRLLGIICMGTGVPAGPGKFVSNACFWDNQLDKKTVPVARGVEVPLTVGFAAGDELDGGTGGVCTACHAGENAFIVHPDDAPFIGIKKLEPKAWYTPLVPAGWPKNPGPNTKLKGVDISVAPGNSDCLDCHNEASKRRLPEIVKQLALGTPPAGKPATPDTDAENYCDAVLIPAINATMPQGSAGPFPDPDYKKHNDFLIAECARVKRLP